MICALDLNRRCADDFAEAWAQKDLGCIARLLHADVIYSASVGPEPDRTVRGKTDVLALIEEMIALDRALANEILDSLFFDDRAVVQWRYTLPKSDSGPICALGIDLMRFCDGLIIEKNSYRKVWDGRNV